MSSPYDLWRGRLHTHVGRLQDWTWTNGREWDELATQHPTLHDEIRRLLDVYGDPPKGQTFAP